MNIALWVVAGLLAVVFGGAGAAKLSTPKEKLEQNPNMAWTQDFSGGVVKLIGALELLAAVGLVLIMIGAMVTHARRKEGQTIVVNLVLAALAAFVAIGRF